MNARTCCAKAKFGYNKSPLSDTEKGLVSIILTVAYLTDIEEILYVRSFSIISTGIFLLALIDKPSM